MAKFFIFWIFLLSYFCSPVFSFEPALLKSAFYFYEQGEKETDFKKRDQAFNEALNLYLRLENEGVNRSTGKLYFNIANCFYKLNETGFSVLYYYRALNLMPTEERVIKNLNIALEKAALPPLKLKTNDPLFFLSFPRQIQIFWGVIGIFFLFASMTIWFPNLVFKFLTGIFLMVGAFFLFNLCYLHFFKPLEAVCVVASSLKSSAEKEAMKLIKSPLAEGTKVQVIEIQKGGKWFKVITFDGQLGYLPAEAVRLI